MEYSILPGEGFGRFRFGMSLEDLKKVSDRYGILVEAARAEGMGEFTQEELDSYRELLSEEQLQDLVEAARNYDKRMDARREYSIDEASINLSLVSETLAEIQVSRRSPLLEFEGNAFFNTNPRAFLAALEKQNGEPPLVNGPDCVFKNINVYVWAAFEILPSGVVRFFTSTDEDDLGQDKSIILTNAPRNLEEDFSEYRPISFM
jgi:hypothetical protein